jgi:hypothetical protein
MNEIEDRLRDAFRADAEAVSPQSLAGLAERATRARPRRPHWRSRLLVPLAAAAAVTAVIVAVTTLSPFGSGGSPAAALPAGVPRFYVISYDQSGLSLVIRSTATGQVTGTIRLPRRRKITSVAPLAGDEAYLALVQPADARPGPNRLEQFTLSKTGRPSALRPLRVPVPAGNPEFTVTPDGQTIAFFGGGTRDDTQVEVINRRTGQTRTWTGCACAASASWYGLTLSLSASGKLLAAIPLRGTPPNNWFLGIRLLPTTARSGSYTRHSRLVLPGAAWAVLSPSGSTLYACLARPGQRQSTWVAYSVATGRQRTIASWHGAYYGGGAGCGGAASASGRYELIQLGGHGHPPAGALDARTGRVIPLPHFNAGQIGYLSGYLYW